MQVVRGTAQSKDYPSGIFSFVGKRGSIQMQEFRFTHLQCGTFQAVHVPDVGGRHCRTRTVTKGSGSRQGRQSPKRWEAIRPMRWGSR